MDASVGRRGSLLGAGVKGGLVTAVLHATPFVNSLNACCCALVVAGGLFAAWILQADSNRSAGTGRCAAAGALAGLAGGVLGVPLAALVSRLALGAGALEGRLEATMAQVQQALAGLGPTAGGDELMESMLRATLGLEFSGWTILLMIVTGFVFTFFGTLGGLLGGVLLRPTDGPRGSSPVPPPPPPPALRSSPPPPPTPSASLAGLAVEANDEDADEAAPLSPDELPTLPPMPDEPSGGSAGGER